jgi:hypothetical protein
LLQNAHDEIGKFSFVIPAKAGIQQKQVSNPRPQKNLDSGSRRLPPAWPE